MGETNELDQFTVLENKTIGRNFARYRKFRDRKALEVASYVGLSEAAYTKYERGESKITVELIQKVSEFLKIDPLHLIAPSSGHVVENSNSPYSIVQLDSTNHQTTNEKQNEMMLKLMENVIAMNDKLMKLLEEKGK